MAAGRMAVDVAIDKLLQSYPEDVQLLARRARETLEEWLPHADEGVDESARMQPTTGDQDPLLSFKVP